MTELPQTCYRFGDVVLDLANLRLNVFGEARSLEPKSFRLLQFLIENRHRVVPKDEILTVVWEGVAVSDNALTRAIAQLRKALDDDPKQPRYIETVPTIGYRFAGTLTAQPVPPAPGSPGVATAAKFPWRHVAVSAAAILAILSGILWLSAGSPASPRRVVAIRQITKSVAADLSPSFSPDGSQIAFSSNRSGQFEIYVRSLAPDGAERQLTSDGQENVQPKWSPDGQYLAYVPSLHGGIRIIPASGGPGRYASDSGDSPAWSPDGHTLAIRELGEHTDGALLGVSIPPDSGPILTTLDVAGGVQRALTSPETPPNPSAPNWLRDGRNIVFGSVPPDRRTELWIADTKSGKVQPLHAGTSPRFPVFSQNDRELYFEDNLARVPGIWHARVGRNWKVEDEEPLIPSQGASPRDLAVSADGLHIAFSRQIGDSAIWSVAVDSNGAAVGEPKPLIRDRSFRNTDAHFSADGSKIAWVSLQADSMAIIYLANADGSSATAMTPADQYSARPQWVGKELLLAYNVRRRGENSYQIAPLQGRPEQVHLALDLDHSDRLRLSPDGAMLAAQLRTPAGLQLVTAGLRGGPVRVLTPASRNIGFPCWSPDGRWLAAEERIPGHTRLVVVPAAGGEIRTVAKEFVDYFPFDWSPDGDRITFAGLQNSTWNIYWISFSTGKLEQVTHFTSRPGFVRYPVWSPKGDRLIFERNDLTSNIYVADLNATGK